MRTTKPPTIIHVINTLEGGGTEQVLLKLLQEFDPTRLRHILVTLRQAGTLAQQLPGHIACTALETRGASRRGALRLGALCRRYPRALIHARNTGVWFDALLAHLLAPGSGLVLGFHGCTEATPWTSKVRMTARAARWAGARFASVSESGRRDLHERTDVPLSHIKVLSNGIAESCFRPVDARTREELRTRSGLSRDDWVVGSVGSLIRVKGYHGLLSAFAAAARQIKNLRLLLVGDGPMRAELRAHAEELGVGKRVVFAGGVMDVTPWLACMDLYVCSSLFEGLSNAILEAMASGLAVITTDVGDHAMVVAPPGRESMRGGLIVPAGAPAKMTEAIVHLHEHPQRRARFAHAARRRTTDFDFATTVKNYQDWYLSLIASRRRDRTTHPAPSVREFRTESAAT